MSTAAVDLRNIWVRYNGEIVLEDISLSVGEKQIISIVGPNGSGKSTLLRTIMGLKEYYRGEIEVFGRPLNSPETKAIFGYLPQSTGYDARFPVKAFDVVAMSRYSRKRFLEKLTRRDHAIIEESLDRVEMSASRDHHFGSLSGGQKQRILIARALALKPRILVLDEPATGLDAVAQDGFYELLRSLRDIEGLTIIIVSHDIGAVSQVVDRLACIKRKIHFHGPPDQCAPDEALARVFGRNIHLVKHDKNCPTCREE